jgi:hypothetical protein
MTAIEVYRTAEEFQYQRSAMVLNRRESERFEQFWMLAERLTPTAQPNDHYSERKLWFCEERGDVSGLNEKTQRRFPEETEWFRLELRKQGGSRNIHLNDFYLFSCNDTPSESGGLIGFDKMLDWLVVKVNECIEMLENGTYAKWVEKNLSYRFRSGLIERKTLCELYPEVREGFRDGLSESEIEQFLKYLDEELPENAYIKDMTANDYYKLCKVCYEVMELEDCAEKTAKELFCRYHDGRDKGLRNLDDNDPEAFARWIYEDKYPDHKWDIYHSRPVLVTDYTEGRGVRLRLGGASKVFLHDNARVFIELRRRGVPISFPDPDSIKRRLCEDDTLKLSSGLFPDEDFDDTYDRYQIWKLPFDERFSELKKIVRWNDIPQSSSLV